jgi:HAD superfamily hydrolase (TIGR01549 family)
MMQAAALVSAGTSRYLEEIRRFPMLEAEEECVLATRWREHGDLRLYDGVYETLEHLWHLHVPVVAYTDARAINCLFRLNRLGIKQFIARLYSPAHIAKELDGSLLNDGFVQLLPASDRKPNPQALIDICSQYGISRSNAVYVGDSLVRDIYMAKQAGVHSVWAKFGTVSDSTLWPRLVRVTHWTDADVEREKVLREEARGIEPDYILEKFCELIGYFEFRSLGDPGICFKTKT